MVGPQTARQQPHRSLPHLNAGICCEGEMHSRRSMHKIDFILMAQGGLPRKLMLELGPKVDEQS